MKRVLFFLPLLLITLTYACNTAQTGDAEKTAPDNIATDSANFTTVKWLDTAVNFGTVMKGEKVKIKYTCTNTGTKPMFIYYVRPGCGCTVADYTKEAILPGKNGEVEAEFDSGHGSAGDIHKSIIVQTNTTNPSPRLTFSGVVTDTDTTKKG